MRPCWVLLLVVVLLTVFADAAAKAKSTKTESSKKSSNDADAGKGKRESGKKAANDKMEFLEKDPKTNKVRAGETAAKVWPIPIPTVGAPAGQGQLQQEGRGRKGAGRRAVLRAVLHAYKGDGAGMVRAAALLPYIVLRQQFIESGCRVDTSMTLSGSVTVGAVDCDVSTELCKYYGAKHALCCIPPQQRPADLRKCTWMGARQHAHDRPR
jgi:hypothetical protein